MVVVPGGSVVMDREFWGWEVKWGATVVGGS